MKKKYTIQKKYNTKRTHLLSVLVLSMSLALYSQTDTCNGTDPAGEVTVGSSCSFQVWDSNNNIDYWNDAASLGNCGESDVDDVWGWFTATSSLTTITYSPDTDDAILTLFTGSCSATMTSLACSNSGGAGVDESITYATTIGVQYKFRVQKTGSGNLNADMLGDICVYIPCNPPTVTAATSIANTSATINWTAASPTPANDYEYVVSTSNTAPAGSGTNSTNTSENITGLTANTTYYVFVRSDCGSGNYSSWDGPVQFTTTNITTPVNDEPCGAIALTTGTSCSTTNGTNVNATASTISPDNTAACASHSGNEPDVWYTAEVAANGTLQVDAFLGTMTDPAIAVYSAPSCSGPFTEIDCDDDSGNGLEPLINITGRTPGEILYIRLWRWNDDTGSSSGTFDICATEDDPYCDATSTNSTDYIEDFSTSGGTTNISNLNSGFSTGGWGDFTSQVVTQFQSGVVDFIVDFSFDTATYGFNIWVDFNDDLDFDDAGENVYSSNGFITGVASSFTIPVGAPVGSHRMRIRSNYLSSNPSACGTISFGEAEDYTLTVTPILCSDNPSNIQISSITTDSATISWDAASPAPGNGYAYYITTNPAGPNFNDTPTGTTTGTSANVSGLSDGTTYYVFVRSDCGGGDGLGAWQGPESFDTELAPPVTSDTEICQGNTGYLVATAACSGGTSLGNTIPGELDAANDPVDFRPCIFIVSTDPCCFSTSSTNWTSIDFEVTVTGTYVFTMDPSVTFDAMGYIVEGAFTPGVCGSGTWIAGDDDSGPALDPQITANLVAGVTYTLYTMPYGSGTTTATFEWNVSGPGSINESTPNGGLDWYTAASGGTLLGSGSPFNPVGVAGSPLADTNTAGTWTFYAECSENPGVRTAAQFTIIQGPEVTVSGIQGPGCDEYTIIFDLVGTAPWGIKYSDGSSSTTVGGINTSPYQLTVNSSSVAAGTVYTASQVFDNSGCNGLPSGISGSATVSYAGCGCITWTGTTNTDWFNDNNWDSLSAPTSIDCVVIPDMAGGNEPEICGTCDANVESITVENGGILTLLPNGTITVQNEVIVEAGGTFELQGDQQDAAQLIQINDVNNSGSITLVREANVRIQDYVYWSSPVESFNIANIGSSLMFYWIPTIGGNPGQHGNWSAASGAMVEGKGYAVRGPSGNGNTSDTATWQTITFNGVPNNGDVTIGINRGTYTGGNIATGPGQDPITSDDDNWNLIGNPYPSALNATTFLNDPANNDIDGAVYLWTHGTSIFAGGVNSPFYGTYVYNYNRNLDYLTYNDTGGTQDGFDGMIGSGQGFYVKMSESSSSTSSTVTFTNGMRSATYRNDQFFRNSNPEPERHRIWLDLITPSENVNRTLLGYIDGASFEVDRSFDATTIPGNGQHIYSLIGNDPYIIQGRPIPFDSNDTVPLGMLIDEIGQYTIAIKNLDGLFEETTQEIFINDLETGIIHNLKEAPYFFNVTESGTYNNRFIIQYTNTTLGINDSNNYTLNIIAPNNEYIKVTSGTNQIESVKVYDLLGRVLVDKQNINASQYTINNVSKASGTYIVKAILVNGTHKIQKVVLKF